MATQVSSQITDAVTQSSSNEFRQMVDDVNYAIQSLTSSLAYENEANMNFFNAILQSALDTAREIQEIEQETLKESLKSIAKVKAAAANKVVGKANKGTAAKASVKVANKKSASGNSTTKAVTRPTPLEAIESNGSPALENMKLAFASKYLAAISDLIDNMVNAQNNQFMLAQAATTQGVMQIYSIDTIADAIAIAKMFDGGK